MNRRVIYLVQGISAGFFFGTASILIRFLPAMDPYTIGFYRLLIAVASLIPVTLLYLKREFFNTLRREGWKSSVLGLIIGGHFAFYISSVKHTTIMNSTVLANTTPIFASIFSWLILGVKPSLRTLLGILIAFIGMAALFFRESTWSPIFGLRGDFEAILCAVLWSLYLVFGRDVRKRAHPVALMIPIYLVSGLFLLILSAELGSFRIPFSQELPFILGLAFLPTLLGHTLHFSSLKGLLPYQTSILALLEPLVASSLAIPLFNELPSLTALLGAAVILTGVYLVVSAER